ncbi:hypothetical protein KJY77_05340 [Canibacter sp. lx-72]|uniref:hypothetical protein n=1 Tax=Canibacter zhuwentaonis TaxID=2837491 RepID=UPI001BDBD94D|nr:hypothetical protein [Canibacter zhuwentaonis]MBT1018554.1 hypothetical protein [Canibacter zhuwentaonis]MBT1035749.1 hypothetical protein [Canibacter zhuwentaonis]
MKNTTNTKKIVHAAEQALLENSDIAQVIRVSAAVTPSAELLIGAKISLPADMKMWQVSRVIACAERAVAVACPTAAQVFISPDVYLNLHDAPTTSAIVTLSYD